jgi:hypothetical protein
MYVAKAMLKGGQEMDNMICESSEVHGEQRVWLAVIARTVEEWVSGPLRARMEAEDYLLHDKVDFETVCEAAGLKASTLRTKLLRLKKNGTGAGSVRALPQQRVVASRPQATACAA